MTGLEYHLDFACDVMHALLDRGLGGDVLGIVERARREDEGLALWERSPLASAVFSGSAQGPSRLNAAWRRLFGEEIPPVLFAAVAEVLHSSETVRVPELSVDAAPGPRYCAATLRPLRGILGATRGVIIACAVITDAVIARQLDVGPEVLVWTAEAAGRRPWFNERWRSYVGARGDELTWQAAVHADDLPRCILAFQEAARLRVSSVVEARVRRADGVFRWHRISFSTGHVGRRWFGTATEIHEERTAQDERTELLAQAHAARADAEQANRLKDQFLASVSHELRAPMTTMLLWEKILRDDSAEPAVRAQALAAIHESALTQSRLVADLLDVSRGISGKLYVDLRPVDLARVCREALEAIAPLADAKGVTLAERGLRTALEVQGDSTRLRQVLDNLLSNAIKFTDEGGRVDVELVRRGRRIAVEVADTGCGIVPEFLPHVFEAFSQTEDALTRERGGLGLGLAIVKQLVVLHHGTVVATSDGRGRGSRFTLSLPAAGVSRAASPPVGVALTPMLAGVRVLVIDDDSRVRDALTMLLVRAGAIVDAARSAEEARERIANVEPSVIVCDIAMPREDGYSFVSRLRAAGSELPVVALTAHAMPSDAARAMAAGFDRHLAKPIDFEQLVSSLQGLLAARERLERA